MKKLFLMSVLAAQAIAQSGFAQSQPTSKIGLNHEETKLILSFQGSDQSVVKKVYQFKSSIMAEAAFVSAQAELSRGDCVEGDTVLAKDIIQGMPARVVHQDAFVPGINTDTYEVFDSVLACEKSRFRLAARSLWFKSIASEYNAKP